MPRAGTGASRHLLLRLSHRLLDLECALPPAPALARARFQPPAPRRNRVSGAGLPDLVASADVRGATGPRLPSAARPRRAAARRRRLANVGSARASGIRSFAEARARTRRDLVRAGILARTADTGGPARERGCRSARVAGPGRRARTYLLAVPHGSNARRGGTR